MLMIEVNPLLKKEEEKEEKSMDSVVTRLEFRSHDSQFHMFTLGS